MSTAETGNVGFAVVGLGMGRHHCRSIKAARGADLVAICDIDAERREKAAQEYGCRAYASVDELLQDPDVQVVNVAVPTGLHAEVGVKVAQSGRHVICEKPLDVNLEKADSLIAACKDHGVKLASIFQRRLHPLSRKIKETIDSGRLGRLHYSDIHLYWYRTDGYYAGGNPPGWRGTFALDGGGACMNQGIHSIDLIAWLSGGVKTVYAKTGTFTHSIEAEDAGTVLVTYRNGALGNITCTTAAYPGLTNDLHICGSAGSGASDPMAVGFDGHTVHVEDMVGAIREGREPIIAGTDARHAVEICAAIQQSAASGQELTLSEES
jgi:UDP-N-acetyl-2-amino-2-deoxyglucuronate dehydrogenase